MPETGKPRDVHRETAVLIFEVDEANVTPEQRRAARTASALSWWCCSADYPYHTPSCVNAIDERAERHAARHVRDDGSPR